MLRAGATIALALASSGCLLSIDDNRVNADASIDAAGAEAASDASDASDAGDGRTGACPQGMIEVPAPEAGAPYCVDATEVTNGAYKKFLAAVEPPEAGTQIAACDPWNNTYQSPGWTGTELDDHPVGSLDWCDAYAYCKWAGKRLCAAVGGGPLDYNSGFGTAASEWWLACTRGGARVYPYGSTYDAQACVGADYDAGAQSPPIAVGAASGCQGGYTGLFDMSGNVSEFLDSCGPNNPNCGTSGPECDLCLLVGGGLHDGQSRLVCSYANVVNRNSHYDDNGFRCCADKP